MRDSKLEEKLIVITRITRRFGRDHTFLATTIRYGGFKSHPGW